MIMETSTNLLLSFWRIDGMTNFFNKNDLIIVIDDDICPNDKEKVKFTDLPENIIKLVADKLELVEDEYKEFSLSVIDEKFESLGKKLDDFIEYNIPKEFEEANLIKYHPFDISEGTIADIVKKTGAKRNFIILDKFLEKNEKMCLLKQYLSELSEIISEFYIGIVFYSSHPDSIKTLGEAKTFLMTIDLTEEQIEKLSMYVNFVDKSSTNKLMCFETAFRKSQNYNLISLYSQSYFQTIQDLKEKIWDINNNEALIHYDYLMEGMQLDDIFFEIYQSRFNKIYNEKCFDNYEEYINPVRKAIQIYESDKSFDRDEIKKRIFISRSVKELNNLLKQETYLYKCKKSDDIRFGDILKLNNSYYMVVTQDCDLSIRLEKNRKNDCINLIKVKYSAKNLKNNNITSKLEDIYKSTYSKQGNDSIISNIKDIIFKNIEPFEKLNIDQTKIENILNTDRKDQEDLSLLNESIELSSDNKFYLIEDIFIYCILLNCQDSDRIEITKESIEKSKEIRVATKKYIRERFEKLKIKYSKLQYDSLKEISDNKLISDLIPIKFSFDEKKELIGLFVDKGTIHRVGHLDYIKAYDIFKEFMSKYSRFSYNNPPLI
ncbi:MAG: hypothetical protein HG448_003750 [Mogibacterium sp.]|nr:hypothetical protein [Mogibacterium sp.]